MDGSFLVQPRLCNAVRTEGQDGLVAGGYTMHVLTGRWQVTRRFADHRAAGDMRFVGDLVVSGPALREVGELHIATRRLESRRALTLSAEPGGRVLMWRPDGVLLADLDLTSGSWVASYTCGADVYTISTELRSCDEIQERWNVRGPEKEYDAIAILRRVSSG